MNKFIAAVAFMLSHFIVTAQKGLENIIVEKYYVTDRNDSAAEISGKLHPGAVTYRVYVDMLPGYRFQAAYGIPGHELRIATSTSFYNSDEGAALSNDISNKSLNKNTVMLDSWLSVGAACSAGFGILKKDDDAKGTIINLNIPPVLQCENSLAGIPVKNRDGILIASPQSVVTTFGIEKELNVFAANDSVPHNVFFTSNGSWASFGGSIGPKPDNKVLIAQLTTDGQLTFELNIQLGSPNGSVENYVAKNPVGKEIQLACLIFPSSDINAKTKCN